jgi:hypothetical protein
MDTSWNPLDYGVSRESLTSSRVAHAYVYSPSWLVVAHVRTSRHSWQDKGWQPNHTLPLLYTGLPMGHVWHFVTHTLPHNSWTPTDLSVRAHASSPPPFDGKWLSTDDSTEPDSRQIDQSSIPLHNGSQLTNHFLRSNQTACWYKY